MFPRDALQQQMGNHWWHMRFLGEGGWAPAVLLLPCTTWLAATHRWGRRQQLLLAWSPFSSQVGLLLLLGYNWRRDVFWGLGGLQAASAPDALYNMACCYAQMGQKAAAILESISESGTVFLRYSFDV